MLAAKMMTCDSSPDSSLNSSSTVSPDRKPLRTSWANEVVRAERLMEKEEPLDIKPTIPELDAADAEENLFTRRDSAAVDVKQKREIAVEFIDGANEQKYERLIKEQKVKTPFKRRHSSSPNNVEVEQSRSNSPNSDNSDGSAANRSGKFDGHKEEKRQRYNSCTSSSSSASLTETDPTILARRQKQIEYGKNTEAYDRYTEMVPRSKRTNKHPRTPNKYGKYSRRAFDGLVRIWRKQLHYYDPPEAKKESNGNDSSSDSSDSD